MPTRGGKRDSKRLNFIDKAIKGSKKKIELEVEKVLGKKIDTLFDRWSKGQL